MNNKNINYADKFEIEIDNCSLWERGFSFIVRGRFEDSDPSFTKPHEALGQLILKLSSWKPKTPREVGLKEWRCEDN